MKTSSIIAGPRKWSENEKATYEVKAEATGPIEVFICGCIGDDYWDESSMSEHKFLSALKGYDPKRELIICLNSQGGSVKDGLGIYNAIKRWQGQTTARITGFACSIASVIPLACDSVISPKSSNWMIHDPLCMTAGNSADHQKSIEMLESCAATMAAIYSEKTGKSRKEMRDVMRAETWFTGEEAKSFGLSDESNDDPVDLKVTEAFQDFRNVPQRLAAMFTKPTNPPPTAAGQKTQAALMQKDKIIALLKEHGKTIAADASDEAFLTALSELVTANKIKQEESDKLKKTETPVIISSSRFNEMEANLKREREARIKGEFEVVAIDRPFLDAAEWLPKLYADETLMEVIKKMPVMPGGADPVRISVLNKGSSLIEDYRKLSPGAERMKFSVAHWHSLEEAHVQQNIRAASSLPVAEQLLRMQRRIMDPYAANSYSATLVTDRMADAFITTIGTKLAALRGFSRDFGVDRLKPRASVQVRKITATSAVQVNPTNFETGDTTSVPITVEVNQISKSWHSTNDELNKGHLVQQGAEKNAQTFANAISDIWTALLTAANYGAPTAIGVAATFDTEDLAPIYTLAKNYGSKNLILDGGHWAFLLPQTRENFSFGEQSKGAFGFDLIAEQNRWVGAVANTVGFVCDPNAIAVASGLPMELPSGQFIELGTVNVPGIDLTVQLAHWFGLASRTHWMSYDVMFGAAPGDTTAGEVLVSA